jgi:hypothetical protein
MGVSQSLGFQHPTSDGGRAMREGETRELDVSPAGLDVESPSADGEFPPNA